MSVRTRKVATSLATDDRSSAILDYVARHKSGVGRMISSVFEIQTMAEAERLATMLATQYPDPEKVSTGIWELLANAIEHGNLEISFAEKSDLLLSGQLSEEIERRLGDPAFRDRYARVEFHRTRRSIRLRVADDGPGFDALAFLGSEPDMTRPNGRGIFIADRFSFHRLRYLGKGNVVDAVYQLD
ncbi:ATP-binding protein [Oryzibacter oryziterrae]|uniref:ATP-binding protein n=1 Tax=Oryzibacter oryziterrae TaxID=2766474 RepID=UPI001F1C0B74|nr:ATP-binding protein [Oryzibacter oryziterrae]